MICGGEASLPRRRWVADRPAEEARDQDRAENGRLRNGVERRADETDDPERAPRLLSGKPVAANSALAPARARKICTPSAKSASATRALRMPPAQAQAIGCESTTCLFPGPGRSLSQEMKLAQMGFPSILSGSARREVTASLCDQLRRSECALAPCPAPCAPSSRKSRSRACGSQISRSPRSAPMTCW